MSLIAPAMSPTVSVSKFTSAGMAACDVFRSAFRTYISATLNGIYQIEAFHPFLTAVETSDRTYILREIPALDMNSFSGYKAIGDFSPRR